MPDHIGNRRSLAMLAIPFFLYAYVQMWSTYPVRHSEHRSANSVQLIHGIGRAVFRLTRQHGNWQTSYRRGCYEVRKLWYFDVTIDVDSWHFLTVLSSWYVTVDVGMPLSISYCQRLSEIPTSLLSIGSAVMVTGKVEWRWMELNEHARIMSSISFYWFWMVLLQERICSLLGSKLFPKRVPGWSGGTMVLRVTSSDIWLVLWQGPTVLAVGAGRGCFGHFSLSSINSLFSPSLWKTAQYRLKYCLKGPLNPKQPTNPPKRVPLQALEQTSQWNVDCITHFIPCYAPVMTIILGPEGHSKRQTVYTGNGSATLATPQRACSEWHSILLVLNITLQNRSVAICNYQSLQTTVYCNGIWK